MGLLGSMMGNASQITVDEIIKKYGQLFYEGETVECAYSLIRDKFIFTNKRLLLIDHQGVTGKKSRVPFTTIQQNHSLRNRNSRTPGLGRRIKNLDARTACANQKTIFKIHKYIWDTVNTS